MGTTAAKLQAALDSKNAVKDSLENKGLSPSNKFSEYAGLIDELENTSDATATADMILEGETAYTAEGKVTGTAEPGIPIVNTAGTGVAYTATVPNLASLKVGKKITIIPHTTSTTTSATLNVNGLGEKYIRQRLSTNSSATTAGPSTGWLIANKPVTLMYNGTYWVAELTRQDANSIYGTVPVANGGTGATTAVAARSNLGALGKADVVDNLESDSSELPLSSKQGKRLNNKKLGCYSARGAVSDFNIPQSDVTILPLTQAIVHSGCDIGDGNSKLFKLDEIGGVIVPVDGHVLVSGCVHFRTHGSKVTRGCYIKHCIMTGNTTESLVEVGSQYLTDPDGKLSNISSGTIIIPVHGGDVIYLCGRSSEATSCSLTETATQLNITYINYG